MQSSEGIQDEFLKSLKWARSHEKLPISHKTLLVASPGSEPPAYILYLGSQHSGSPARLLSPSEATLHYLPYNTDVDKIIGFTTNPKDFRMIRLAETASTLNIEMLLVSPEMHPAYEERLEMLGVKRVKPPKPHVLSMSILSLLSIPRPHGERAKRLEEELDALGDAVEWVAERYRDQLSAAKSFRGAAIAYTPATKPGAVYHCMAIGDCSRLIPLESSLTVLSHGGREVIVYSTTVEEGDYKDVVTQLAARANMSNIRFNTDPLTATIYSMIAAILITNKLI